MGSQLVVSSRYTEQVRALWVIALVGCGRVGFDSVGGDRAPDAYVPVVCGDGVCAGNAGELCNNCAADCATLAQVCGNGACEAGEQPSCYADCGPVPWPWSSDATAMLAALNQARTNGRVCPGGTVTLTGPALVYDPTLEPTAREWAWEAAHEDWQPANGCNGRTSEDRLALVGATSGWKTFAAASPADAIEMLLAYSFACPELMRATNTQFAGAAAYDVIVSHSIMLR